jgi:uncharacterized membrane protein
LKTFLKALLLIASTLAICVINNASILAQLQPKGRILFDEAHGQFWVDRIDLGYTSLAKELRSAGYQVLVHSELELTKEILSGYDVLVIANAWKAYSSDEIEAIKEFVKSGKGLLLIGLGWSWVDYQKQSIDKYPINMIGREFGMTINDDIIADETNNQGEPASPIFCKFASHPVTSGLSRVAPVKGYPSSLTLSRSAQAIIMGDEDAYSTYHERVYPKGTYPPVAAVSSYGSGRVVLLGHDGFFAVTEYTRSLYEYDNLKLALNIFDWLSEKEIVRSPIITTTQEVVKTMVQPALIIPNYALLILPIIALIGAFAVLVVRKKPGQVKKVGKQKKMEVKVLHDETKKIVKLEARPDNSIGSIVETVVNALKLPKEDYSIVFGNKKFSKDEYSLTLDEIGVKEGDILELIKAR